VNRPAGRAGELREGADPVAPERIGAYLARQRQLRGISAEDLAAQMRIPLRSLQRLEAGAFDHDPDGFARGFVRTVAIALGLPPDETIARMLPEAGGDDDGAAAGALARLARAVGLAAALGAVAASGWMWLANGASRTLAPTFRAREDGLVVRRDAVRALAEQHGLLGAGAGSGTLAPLPPPEPAPEAPAPEPAPDAAPGP
jgi:hypothetical protein